MMTILSTVISFLMGGVPKILDMFQDSKDKKHELELARMQTEREIQMMKEGYAAQAKSTLKRTNMSPLQTARYPDSLLSGKSKDAGWILTGGFFN